MSSYKSRRNFKTDFQASIYSKLNRHPGLSQLLESDRIYDSVPDNDSYPFIVIGEDVADDWNTHTFDGYQGTSIINVWTQNTDREGKEFCSAIMHQIWLALHNQDLELPERRQINFRCQRQEIVTQPDNRTQNGIMTFNFTFGGDDL